MFLANLFPKEFNFFDSFDKQADLAVDAAVLFKKIVADGNITQEMRQQMHDIEHKGDEIAYSIIDTLNKTFITPFDREDIHALAKELDDVNDILTTIINRMIVIKLTSGRNKYMVEFADAIESSVKQLSSGVKGLRNMKNANSVLKCCFEVNRLESVGDKLRDKALVELFENEKDPIAVIKWKEIYQISEASLDICKAIAHVIESILVKQA